MGLCVTGVHSHSPASAGQTLPCVLSCPFWSLCTINEVYFPFSPVQTGSPARWALSLSCRTFPSSLEHSWLSLFPLLSFITLPVSYPAFMVIFVLRTIKQQDWVYLQGFIGLCTVTKTLQLCLLPRVWGCSAGPGAPCLGENSWTDHQRGCNKLSHDWRFPWHKG